MKRYAIGLITGILLTVSALMFMGENSKNMGDYDGSPMDEKKLNANLCV